MDTLLSMRVFRQVAEGQGFAQAAEKLGISTAMTSKHVAHLEQRLGARLLNRTSRHVSLTEAGGVYYEQCREALDMLESAAASIAQGRQEPRGSLKVTAPVWCANRRFADILASYCERYPQVILDMRLENRKVDLVSEGYDLALRATREPSPTLIVRPICSLQFHLVATPGYVQSHGKPNDADELASYGAILPTYIALQSLVFNGPGGAVKVRLNTAMRCSDTTLAYQSVLAGIGMAYLPDWLVADDLKAGRLQNILPNYSTEPITLFAAYTSRKFMASKVRTFIDFVSEALKKA